MKSAMPKPILSSQKPGPVSAVSEDKSKRRRATRSRFKAQPRAGLRLEPRDEALLTDLFLHRAMARGQIEALYFGSTTRCNTRLRQLFDHRYVARHYLPAAPFGAQAIYLPGRAAVPLLSRTLEMDPAEARKQCRGRTPSFLEHTLAIVDVRIALEQAAARREDMELDLWLPEIRCRHEYEIETQDKSWQEVFKPDGFVRLQKNDGATYRNYFLEVDLGHTSSRQFLGKLHTHQRYLESGLFREIYGCEEFRTLVITTGPRRLHNLRALLETRHCDLFWFSTFDEVSEKGVLAPIWRMPLGEAHVSLV